MNNAIYYHYFESIIASYVVQCGSDAKMLGLAVSSSCQVGVPPGRDCANWCKFFAPVSFPQVLELGLRVTKLQERSVTFEIGLFAEGEDEPAAVGVMAYLETEEIRGKLREGLSNLYPENGKL